MNPEVLQFVQYCATLLSCLLGNKGRAPSGMGERHNEEQKWSSTKVQKITTCTANEADKESKLTI